MQVCSDAYDPKKVTPARMPAGPTFSLGSLAIDAASPNQQRESFTESIMNEAANTEVKIAEAKSSKEAETLLNRAILKLEIALDAATDSSRQNKIRSLLKRVRSAKAQRDIEFREARLSDIEHSNEVALDLQESQFTSLHLIEGEDDRASSTYRAGMTDGRTAYFKPDDGFQHNWRDSVPSGGEWIREVAAYKVDKLIGLNVVPVTVAIEDPQLGLRGSLQQSAISDGRNPYTAYSGPEREAVGVLDYIIGNVDRHLGNYRSFQDGSIAAIDHGYSFPENTEDAIRSSFTADILGASISDNLMARLSGVAKGEFYSELLGTGLSRSAVEGSWGRLREIVTQGAITGGSWRGKITSSFDSTVFLANIGEE